MSGKTDLSVWLNEGKVLIVPQFSTVGRLTILFGICIALVMLTRLPYKTTHLHSFDDVNLALAIQDFNPVRSQPQPPGYPLFVAESRIFNPLFHTPEQTFAFLQSLVSGLVVGLLYLIGRKMYSTFTGMVGAAILFVNPIFWFSGLTSPLRPHLALVSLLVAYFCWRAISGEKHFFYWTSLALGLGSGFRPELSVLLFPLWILAAWHCRDSKLRLIRGTAILGVSALIWIAAIIIASGGLSIVWRAFSTYLSDQTIQTSVLQDRSSSWTRWVARAILWNGLGVLPWVWAIPFGWVRLRAMIDRSRHLIFLAVWIVPAFVFYFTVHIAAPDHALTTIPALCLIGGFCVVEAGRTIVQRWMPELVEATALGIGFVLVTSTVLFFGEFPLPKPTIGTGFRGLQSIRDSILIGTYETTYARVKWVDQMMDLSIIAVDQITRSAGDRPIIFIWTKDGEPVWRKVCYYMPNERVWSLDEAGDPAVPKNMAQLWEGSHRLSMTSGAAPLEVSVPRGARIIWMVAPLSVEALRKIIPLESSGPLYYSDLNPDSSSIHWGSFNIVQH